MLAIFPGLLAVLLFTLVASSCGEWCAKRLRLQAETGMKAGLVAAAVAVQAMVFLALG
ncbi:MAG: hypothetical protein V9H69_23275 [Anaerolineae bacterium]|jgi:hypothetical protein